MELAVSRDHSTPVVTLSEVEELNHILEVERRLVIKTQENYKQLKQKFLDLCEENDLLKKEIQILRPESSNKNLLRTRFEELDERNRDIIKQIEEDNHDREIRNEQFRTETLAELQRVFRKELADQISEVDRLKKEKDELVDENDRLLGEVRTANTIINELKKNIKKSEIEMRDNFAKQIEELIESTQNNGIREKAKDSKLIVSYQETILKYEDKMRQMNQERIEIMASKEGKIGILGEQLSEQKQRELELKVENERYRQELQTIQLLIERKEEEIKSMGRKLNTSLKEHMEQEAMSLTRERKLREYQEQQAMVIEETLLEMERCAKEKDIVIEGLRQQINESKIEDKSYEEQEKTLLFDREHLDKLELELKNQKIRMEKKETEYQGIIDTLKRERNKMEIIAAELRKKLLTSPETILEVNRLKETVKSKDIEINRAREHYRKLLKRMKSSLLNLEKRHRKTQEKLEASIIL